MDLEQTVTNSHVIGACLGHRKMTDVRSTDEMLFEYETDPSGLNGLNDMSGLNDMPGLNDMSCLNDMSVMNDPRVLLEGNLMNSISALLSGEPYGKDSVRIPTSYGSDSHQRRFYLSPYFDTFIDICLEVKENSALSELDINDLLDINMGLWIGGTCYYNTRLVTVIFTQALHRRFIRKDENGVMQIPLYNFDNFGPLGIPALHFQNVEVKLTGCNNAYTYNVILTGTLASVVSRNKLREKNTYSIHIEDQLFESRWRDSYNLNFSGICKYIIILIRNGTPCIDSATLDLGGSNTLIFNYEDILRIEILDLILYILPLAGEFSTLERMSNAVRTCKMSTSGINFSQIDGRVKLRLSTMDLNCVNTSVTIIGVTLNIIEYRDGAVCCRYGS